MDILRNVPLGIYLETPRTWLHGLDPRVKLICLLSVILSPVLATSSWRLLVVVVLILLTLVSGLPSRVWIRQLPLLLGLGTLTFLLTAFAPDALGVTSVPQRQGPQVPAYGLMGLESAPLHPANPNPSDVLKVDWETLPPTPGRYELVSFRWFGREFQVSQRTLSLAIRGGTLIFTLFYSTNLFLVTTAPEEITEGLERLSQPLRHLRVPTYEIIFTATLALRFLPLVLEEVQNLIRAVRTRDIRWQTLGLRGTIHFTLALVERLFENLFLRAEQTATAIQARGYASPNTRVRWHILQFRVLDWILLGLLPIFWFVRLAYFSDF